MKLAPCPVCQRDVEATDDRIRTHYWTGSGTLCTGSGALVPVADLFGDMPQPAPAPMPAGTLFHPHQEG